MQTLANTIQCKNDAFRKSFAGGKVILTSGVSNDSNLDKVIQAVKSFNTFTEDNDPYQEHDFGSITIDGEKYFWKINYYENEQCKYGYVFEEGKPDVAFRVITIMLADEY